MIEFFRKAADIKRELEPEAFQSPVFLTGCMRSGTTFFANLITEHPQLLHLEGELNQVWTEIGGIDCRGNRVYADRKDILPGNVANMAAYYERCRLEFGRDRYKLWRIINKGKKGSGGVKKQWENLLLLNKNVHLINRVDYVLNMFPSSKLILIVRPIEAQVNSLKLHFEGQEKKGVFIEVPSGERDSWINTDDESRANWNLETLARKWIQLNKTALEDIARNAADRTYVMDYRQMVNNPMEVLEGVYHFLGLKPFRQSLKNTVSDRKTFNTNTGGNPLDDWKTRLSEAEIETIEKVKKEYSEDYTFITSKLRA